MSFLRRQGSKEQQWASGAKADMPSDSLASQSGTSTLRAILGDRNARLSERLLYLGDLLLDGSQTRAGRALTAVGAVLLAWLLLN